MKVELLGRAAALWLGVFTVGGILLSGCGPALDCVPGEVGCECREDGTCGVKDGARLLCESGRCAEDSCPAGAEGCLCRAGGLCDGALSCVNGECVSSTCVPGQAGCPCGSGGACEFGTCTDGFCVAGEATEPPETPTCYTPCQSGLDTPEGYVACPDDGLMPRCLDGKVCVDGSCVAPDTAAPSCTRETDCPDFQTCIQGKCFSNCDTNDECMGGRECFRHVCRMPCRASLDSCATGTACVTSNGDTGFCMPVRPATSTSTSQGTTEGTFEVSTDAIAFSTSQQTGSLLITNRAPTALEFKIRKVDHVESLASGQNTVTDAPLAWLSMGEGDPQRVQELTVLVDGRGGTREIRFATATNPDLNRWEGRVEIVSARLGRRLVQLSYVSRPEGRWAGKMFYFANFGDAHLSEWVAQRDDATALGRVGNAFIQRWGALRQGRLAYDEFEAAVSSTLSESWNWESMRAVCAGAAACYPYHRAPGYAPYSDSLESYPIPTASTELPIALNLRSDDASPNTLVGRIVSDGALHYPGEPAVTLAFASDPAGCKPGVTSSCLAPLSTLSATVRVGGRYLTSRGDSGCSRATSGTFSQVAIPWLIPGFEAGTSLDSDSGLRYRYECRDRLVPFGDSVDTAAINLSLAQSNPIPDGRPRVRELELVDGALVNQTTLFIIFRERFVESFLGDSDTEGFSTYGFMMLTREPAELKSDAFVGTSLQDERTPPEDVLDTRCSADIVSRILGEGQTINSSNVSALALGVLDGTAMGPAPAPITEASPERVHYLCHDTGLFDGGKDDTFAKNIKVACPAGSGVTFFTTNTSLSRDDFAALSCQQTTEERPQGTCQQQLDLWKANGSYSIRLNPIWRCSDPAKVYCDDNRSDLRVGKTFYPPSSTSAAYVPLLTEVENAFRYKTQFRARSGTSVGFAPEICVPNSNAIPYCYDPSAIELASRRVDCAVDLFGRHAAELTPEVRGRLKSFLTTSFGYTQEATAQGIVTRDGFERLNAELLIMQGDEAYTRSFASRFDLAGSRMVSFQGSLFEPGGINLAGGAGNEMHSLYMAAQYYQLVLDRFYALSPFIWQSVAGTSERNVITRETVVSYFDRLIRASTQKARAWSEIAKRYQSFNRPDLARHVVRRAYAAAHLESIVLSRMILRVVTVADPADRAFITSRAELATLGYRAALLDMREVYASISDERTFFGDAPDFIPFPALDPGDVNAFAKLLTTAKQSAAMAATKEEVALSSTRSFDTDAAQFQSELIRVKNNYENQLADLCGSFQGSDGRVHPATRTYAYLSERTRLMGDPCGLVGNGRIHDAMAAVEMTAVDLRTVDQRFDNVHTQMTIETDRVEAQCDLIFDLAEYRFNLAGEVNTLKNLIRSAQTTQSLVQRGLRMAETVGTAARCGGTDCPAAVAAAAAIATASIVADSALAVLDVGIAVAEGRIDHLHRLAGNYEASNSCEVLRTDSRANIDRLVLELSVIELEALKTDYRLRLEAAQIQKLRNDATRLLAEKEEIEAQTINVEAARNDPNVRIYKNDAVILADQTFARAVQDAYRATRVFEYYTSQSYAKLGELFLIRMVAHGDYNLETYLIELESVYRDFQQQFGNPDVRVEVLSLRDDILAIPRLDAEGRSLSQSERTAMFRTRLTDASFVDERGHLAMPFMTTLARLSPLTRNHKVLHVESELIGTDVGDTVARLYVRQRGTGTVRSVAGANNYYRLPERTAVLNPFINGVRVFSPEVYRTDRLRDRPFVNTHWELVINQKDELANKDINLQSLSDVRLYVYYSDFTQL